MTKLKLPRRKLLFLVAAVATLSFSPGVAKAENYPSRPVRLVVGLPPGSSPDIVARLMTQWLSERLGQHFVVDNKPGANSNIATEAVVRSAPDGYVLLQVLTANASNSSVYATLNFNFIRDIAPIAGIIRVPQVLEVHPSVPVKSVPEFIAYAKAHPNKLNMASGGIGSSQHIAGELFKMMTGVDVVHVPYRNNPRPDLIGGQVQVMFDTLPASMELIRSGKLRALAVTTATRVPELPNLPTIGEFVPGYEASAWQGMGAPRHTPQGISEKLNREINVALADPNMRAQLANLGAIPMPMTAAEFGKFIVDETGKWAKVFKFAHIKPE